MVKNPPANPGNIRDAGLIPWVGKIPLEEGMAAHSRILAWRIPMDRGAWQATVHGVAKSQTRLKRLGTHFSIDVGGAKFQHESVKGPERVFILWSLSTTRPCQNCTRLILSPSHYY